MQYRSSCGKFKYHFMLANAGWVLLCYGRDPMYQVPDNLTFRHLYAKKMQERGDDFVLPVFAIDYINNGIVNVAVDIETSGADETRALVEQHVRDLDSELNLGLIDALGESVWSSFLIGLNKTRFFRSGFSSLESTPELMLQR